jgi:hypothetical protein
MAAIIYAIVWEMSRNQPVAPGYPIAKDEYGKQPILEYGAVDF